MAGKQNSSGVVYLLMAAITMASMVGMSSAATHIVGDTSGWTIPNPPNLYTNWVSKQSFHVGDVLVFNFPAKAHTVAEVSKTSYDSCTTSNPLSAVMTTSPSNITISSAGTHYFLCTVTGHCSAGQKLSLVATSAASSSPAPTPSSPAPAPTTVTPSSSPATTPTSTPPAGGPTAGTTPPAGGPTAGTTPAAGGPTAAAGGPSSEGGSSPPSSDSFATTGGVSLLSLASLAVLALLF